MGDQKKIDWMYDGVSGIVDTDDYLKGRKIDKTFEIYKQEQRSKQREADIAAASDTSARLSDDPLMQIEQRRIEIRKAILSNPVKLKQLQEGLKSQKEPDDPKPGSSVIQHDHDEATSSSGHTSRLRERKRSRSSSSSSSSSSSGSSGSSGSSSSSASTTTSRSTSSSVSSSSSSSSSTSASTSSSLSDSSSSQSPDTTQLPPKSLPKGHETKSGRTNRNEKDRRDKGGSSYLSRNADSSRPRKSRADQEAHNSRRGSHHSYVENDKSRSHKPKRDYSSSDSSDDYKRRRKES